MVGEDRRVSGAPAKARVAFFLAYPGGGGVERVLITIANEFARRGKDVDLVLRSAEGPSADLISSDVNVVDLKAFTRVSRNILVRLRLHMTNLRALFSLCGYIRSRRPRAIISPFFRENLLAILAKKLTGSDCRLVIRQAGTLGWLLSNACGSAHRIRLRWLTRCLYPRADAVIAVSQGVAEDLVRVVPVIGAKLRVIYNPVDLDRIQRLSLEEPGHPWFNGGSHQVVLGAGRLEIEKDFPTLVRAFARVRQTRPSKLVILGEGRERQKLEELVSALGLEKEVSLPGFAKNPFAYMSRAAVFVLSSTTEGFPNVLSEALASGCPVVSTDCPSGPREILEDGKWGELVPVGDVDALAAATGRTLQNPPAPNLLKQRAAFFSVDRAVGQYLDTL